MTVYTFIQAARNLFHYNNETPLNVFVLLINFGYLVLKYKANFSVFCWEHMKLEDFSVEEEMKFIFNRD